MKSTVLIRFVIFHLILFALLRAVFYVAFKPVDSLSVDILQKAFALGLRFDLRLACVLALPMVLFAWRGWNLQTPHSLRHWRRFYVVASAVWMTFYVFDFGFYSYLNSRMNSSALLFLEHLSISLGMVWESYPVLWILGGFFAIVLVYGLFLRRFVFRFHKNSFLGLPGFLNGILFIALFCVGLYGNISQYPLRWSEAFFSPHHFASHFALNPVLYFFESYEFTKQKDYDVNKTRESYKYFADYLGVVDKNDDNKTESLNFARPVKGTHRERAPNVVVIVMESLSLSKTNLGENPLRPTPELEKIASQSHWFSNYYSSSEGTARNLFAIMTSIPDVTKVQTSTRNPLVVDQKIIANSYANYRKMYFIGGSASWANIRGIFSHNIEGIEIFEEDTFNKNKTDVWGVSDLDLFIEAHERFAKLPSEKPFFAVIQAASFHRPYTIPKDAKNFKSADIPMTKLKEAGFYSLEQFNSLRFTDYSLGYFFSLAQKSEYYKNTLFVITGDHGLPDDGGVNVPEGVHLWNLEKYHVPLVLHHAQIFAEPAVDNKMAGHTDLMTTAAAVAGVDHTNTTLGRNLFDPQFDKERYSFIYNYTSELNEYGLVSQEFYLHTNDKDGAKLYMYRGKTPQDDVQSLYPDIYVRMKNIGEGYYQTAKYMMFNNQKASAKKKAGSNQPH